MQLTIDDMQQGHIYSCLLVGNAEFGKVKKSLAKLNREDDAIDDEIARNAELRRLFNPRAEEEARAASRKDDAQMDLTEVETSGETGGGIPAGQTFTLHTGAERTLAELRDGLLEAGYAVLVIDLDAWSDDERRAANDYIDGMRQALAESDGPVAELIDAPDCVDRDGTTVARLQELLAAGPYRVREILTGEHGTDYSVVREASEGADDETDTTTDDKLDAEIRAARLNRTVLQRADMTDDEILEWAAKGPWTTLGSEAIIVAGTQREVCESEIDAMGRAARYNRSIAQRAQSEPVAADQEVALAAEGRAD